MKNVERDLKVLFGADQIIVNPVPNRKRKPRTPEIIETEKGFFLTLRERKIMKLILDEANERVDVNRALSCNRFREAENVCLLIADYVKAYRQGNITQADIERCG